MNTKNYLNSEFLNTAFFHKSSEPKATISYLEYQEFDNTTSNPFSEKEIGIKLKQKDIYCNKIIFSKDAKNSYILINTLIDKLFNLYLQLAKENEKSISKTTLKPKSNFLVKWIKGNSDILIQNQASDIRRLVTKIIHASNAIAVNNRIGPATFIIISRKLLPIIQNTTTFVYDVSGKIKEYEAISQVGKLMDLDVFINNHSQDNTILVGRYSSQTNLGGVTLIEHDIKIDEKYITWIGAIDSYSPNSKYMFDLINVNIIDELPWYKKIIYKILEKRKKKYDIIYIKNKTV